MKKKDVFCGIIYVIFSIITIMCMEQQIITPYISLPHDMWNKIIACSTDESKDALAQTCKTLNELSRKTNQYIYTHSPLVLSDKDRQFGLLCATYYGNTSSAENLLNHGAHPDHFTAFLQLLPLDLAKIKQHKRLINLFEKYNTKILTPIPLTYALAVYIGDLPFLNAYLENKGDSPHYEEPYNNNPILHSAIFNGHTHIVERLMQDSQIERYLDFAGWYGIEPLHFAAQHNRTAITQLLLAACPTMINNVCRGGFSALHIAVKNNNYHVAEALIQYPLIKVNWCSLDRNSPLHTAVKNANLDMIKLLLSAPNICLNIKNNDDKTPLDLTKNLFRNDIKKLLISKGAKGFFYISRIAPWNDIGQKNFNF